MARKRHPAVVRGEGPSGLSPARETVDALGRLCGEKLVAMVLEHASPLTVASPDHGPDHWLRVVETGLALARETPGAYSRVVRAFGLFHDSQRESEHDDPLHGHRAWTFFMRCNGDRAFGLTGSEKAKLSYALRMHPSGFASTDPMVGVCWDADRLDLPRVGIDVDPALLSTAAGLRVLAGSTGTMACYGK